MWFASASTTAPNCSQPLPDVYYVTDHYLNYSAVLVRLSRVTPDVLRDLLGMAHKFVTADDGTPFAIAQPKQACLVLAGFRAIRERQTPSILLQVGIEHCGVTVTIASTTSVNIKTDSTLFRA